MKLSIFWLKVIQLFLDSFFFELIVLQCDIETDHIKLISFFFLLEIGLRGRNLKVKLDT